MFVVKVFAMKLLSARRRVRPLRFACNTDFLRVSIVKDFNGMSLTWILKNCTENGHHARYARSNKHFPLWRPLHESYQRLIFHNSQLTFPSVVVCNGNSRLYVGLVLIVCLKCIIICYYIPIVRNSSFLLCSDLICRRISIENHLFAVKIILHEFYYEIYTSIYGRRWK